jgi:predicted MFS family arabinose efflux permease
LLIGGQLMTAVPSLVYVLPDPDAWLMLSAAAARGLGMGIAIVVSVVLVAELAAPGRRGRSIGYFGFALSAPGVVLPSVGIALLEAGRVDADALIAFVIGVAGALLVFKLPRATQAGSTPSSSLLAAFRQPGLLSIFAGFVLVSSSFGAVITFAPIALPAAGIGSAAVFLFVAGAARAASRWLAGVLGDRRPGRLVLAGGIGVAFVGLVALATRANPAVVIFSGFAYGAGYGAVQTAVYLAMSARGSSDHRNTISAIWNSGIDLGASLGGSLLGLTAARYGYGIAIWAIPAVVLGALPLILVPARPLPAGGEGPAGSPVEPAGMLGP